MPRRNPMISDFGFRISDFSTRGSIRWQEASCPRLGAMTGRAVSDNVGSVSVAVTWSVESQHCQRGNSRGARRQKIALKSAAHRGRMPRGTQNSRLKTLTGRVTRNPKLAYPVSSGCASLGSESSWWRALKDPPTRRPPATVGGTFAARHHSASEPPGRSVNLNEADTRDPKFQIPNPKSQIGAHWAAAQ